ncbi:hypothetical protein COO60DRAFT_1499080 [Scenedesmus sp. NREL 46B-D3]|nr:hypothetical protein COO60DRAFT_1499080 [Scenedesmus sp. NREL 46B-D3]
MRRGSCRLCRCWCWCWCACCCCRLSCRMWCDESAHKRGLGCFCRPLVMCCSSHPCIGSWGCCPCHLCDTWFCCCCLL